MDYRVEDIEDQIIATLKANSNLSGMNIETHAGQVNINMFIQPQFFEGLIPNLPIIYVRYDGRSAMFRDSIGNVDYHELYFMLYVLASSLRNKKESQRSCYGLLRNIYDSLHGKFPYSDRTYASNIPILSGTKISLPDFRSFSPLLEKGGEDEKLVIELPKIAIYSTVYKIQVGT